MRHAITRTGAQRSSPNTSARWHAWKLKLAARNDDGGTAGRARCHRCTAAADFREKSGQSLELRTLRTANLLAERRTSMAREVQRARARRRACRRSFQYAVRRRERACFEL